MARPSSWLYVWVLLAATVGGLLFTPLACRFATRLGVVDEPAGHKTHLEAVSLLGGLGIYAGAFALAATDQQCLVAVLSAGVAGGALGFLPSNYPRARVFMGDAGSMFLGFVLAFLGIRLRFLDRAQSTTFLIPVLLLGVPLFD